MNGTVEPGNLSPHHTIKDMEVHHHGHVHENKKWREYIFQFIMLLLAVFLGSFAETKREGWVEGNKEHEYIASMVGDIEKDTAEISITYSNIFYQIQMIDSLELLFTHDLRNNITDIVSCYQLAYYLFWYNQAIFNEKTYAQLTNSGNMRIIRRTGAADSIMGYYNAIKRIDQQKQQYVSYINMSLEALYKVFDYSYLRQRLNTGDSTLQWANLDWHDLHLRTTDPSAITDLGATLENTKLVIYNYMLQLKLIGVNADKLIVFLQDKYNLKE